MVKYLLFKYLRFDKSQPFITLSAILAFLGVSVGLMVLIIAMAIMNGFDKEFERKLFTMNYPITIISYMKGSIDDSDVAKLKEQFKELKFSPYISTQAIVKHGNKLEGGLLFGVNFDYEKQINSVVKEALSNTTPSGFEILLGKGIADDFALSLNEKVTMLFMQLSAGGLVSMPTMKRFNYVANFSSGLIAYDKAYSYTDVNALAKILGYESGRYDGIHIYSDNPKSDIVKLNQNLSPGQRAIGWWEQNGNFFSALELEKRALFIVLMLIILVASLNIISSLLMTVMNRRQEIALLLALGASKSEIKKSFFTQGVVIGGSGIIFGLILGLFGVWLLGSFDIVNLPADVYGSSKLPMELALSDLAMILIGAIVIVLLSSYYPAKKASNVDILTTLRNE